MTLPPAGYHTRAVTLGCMAKGKGVSSQASLLGSWVPNSMTLPLSGYHAKAVTFGCMAKGKGVSSRASLIISAKIPVGNAVSSRQFPLVRPCSKKKEKAIKEKMIK